MHFQHEGDQGQIKLQAYLHPGEVLLTNISIHTRLRAKVGSKDLEEWTPEKQVAAYMASGEFSSVRLLPVAFSQSGDFLSEYQSVVGIRKPSPPSTT